MKKIPQNLLTDRSSFVVLWYFLIILTYYFWTDECHRINMSGGWTLHRALVCGLSGCHAGFPILMRSASCRYPVYIRWSPFDLSCERINYRTGNRVPGTSSACAFCDHSTNVLSVFYVVHIRFVRYTSIALTLVDCSLPVICPVRMCSLQLLRRLTSPDKHFLHFFCPFSVRYLYPLIFGSTINVRRQANTHRCTQGHTHTQRKVKFMRVPREGGGNQQTHVVIGFLIGIMVLLVQMDAQPWPPRGIGAP